MRRIWFGKAWRSLSRLRWGVILLALLLATVVVGTVFPQEPQQADTSAWWMAVRERYGFLYSPLRALGLFNTFGSLWFKALLGLLLLSTLACFLNRVWPLTKVVFRPRTRLPDERFERAALQAQLDLSSAQAAETAVRRALHQRRYRVQVEERALSRDGSQHRLYLRADRSRLPRLGTLFTHTGLVFLLLGAAWSGVRGWRAQGLAVSSDHITSVGNDTGLGLQCDRFTILRYDDGTPRDYRAQVTLVSRNREPLTHGTVRVNRPLTYAGVSYYLEGYHVPEPSAGLTDAQETCQVALNAVYDPGYGPIVIAGACLLIGMTLTFHFPHRRLWARIEPTGKTHLVGSTAWDKERFGRQFDTLVTELGEAAASGKSVSQSE